MLRKKGLTWFVSLLLAAGSLTYAGEPFMGEEEWDGQELVWNTEEDGGFLSADVPEEEQSFSYGEEFFTSEALVGDEEEETVYESPEEIGLALRECMKRREAQALFTYRVEMDVSTVTEEFIQELADGIIETARAETGAGDEGDYLFWHLGSIRYGVEGSGTEESTELKLSYLMEYYSNAEQELALEEALASAEAELALEGRTDFEKIRMIYDYIISHVSYDWEEAEAGVNPVSHTAYSALVEGKAVCQGYALLFYRMLRDQGIPVRAVTGISKDQNHMWNIVELDGLYYNCDVTWDDPDAEGDVDYTYFLKSEGAFEGDHVRDEQYLTPEYMADYPLSTVDYTLPFTPTPLPTEAPTPTPTPTPVPTETPTPTPTPTPALMLEQEAVLYTKGEETDKKFSFALTVGGIEDYTLTYKSSKAKVAAVDQDGLITAKKKGSAVITASVSVEGRVVAYATCQVTVKKPTLKASALTVKKGKKAKLKVKASPADWTFTFTSSDPKVCTVDAKGKVKGVKKGSAKITIQHGTLKATAKVKVTK